MTTIPEAEIRAILASPSDVALVAQPIEDLRRGAIVGYELLARFRSGRSPDLVFAAAVAHGLGEELEALVLERALALASTRPSDCFVSINVDPSHLLAPRVRELLERRASLAGIVFELTEHRPMPGSTALCRALDGLRQQGAMIALDDAGTGHSGLKQLLELRPQFVKIDRELITDIDRSEAKRALVQMVTQLASRLDAWVLCEGIETEAECATLCRLGVPLGQGYYLGRPTAPWAVADAEITRQLRARAAASESLPTVETIVEPCAVVAGADPWPDGVLHAIRVDALHRPIAMRLTGGDEGALLRQECHLLRVKRSASLAELALRAATRSARLRWDPLVCIDERGRLRGLIPVERLVCELASERLDAGRDPAYAQQRRRMLQPTPH